MEPSKKFRPLSRVPFIVLAGLLAAFFGLRYAEKRLALVGDSPVIDKSSTGEAPAYVPPGPGSSSQPTPADSPPMPPPPEIKKTIKEVDELVESFRKKAVLLSRKALLNKCVKETDFEEVIAKEGVPPFVGESPFDSAYRYSRLCSNEVPRECPIFGEKIDGEDRLKVAPCDYVGRIIYLRRVLKPGWQDCEPFFWENPKFFNQLSKTKKIEVCRFLKEATRKGPEAFCSKYADLVAWEEEEKNPQLFCKRLFAYYEGGGACRTQLDDYDIKKCNLIQRTLEAIKTKNISKCGGNKVCRAGAQDPKFCAWVRKDGGIAKAIRSRCKQEAKDQWSQAEQGLSRAAATALDRLTKLEQETAVFSLPVEARDLFPHLTRISSARDEIQAILANREAPPRRRSRKR